MIKGAACTHTEYEMAAKQPNKTKYGRKKESKMHEITERSRMEWNGTE